MKTILGIDVGMKGALAFYSNDNLIIHDMPIHEIVRGKKKRNRIDIQVLLSMLEGHGFIDHAFIEQVWAQPGNGAAAAFTYGFGCGALECAIASAGIPFTYVTSMKWKKAMSCPKDKDAARMRASQLLPQFSDEWPLKKHDGRAEAALIALYGYKEI